MTNIEKLEKTIERLKKIVEMKAPKPVVDLEFSLVAYCLSEVKTKGPDAEFDPYDCYDKQDSAD